MFKLFTDIKQKVTNFFNGAYLALKSAFASENKADAAMSYAVNAKDMPLDAATRAGIKFGGVLGFNVTHPLQLSVLGIYFVAEAFFGAGLVAALCGVVIIPVVTATLCAIFLD
ncbi:hypothetical protein SM033_00269 [Vibrio phage vB_VpaM_sm033]|nr:hypothetical protein SM033_00269 [Vibrio phage vB_VpaM_sm033]